MGVVYGIAVDVAGRLGVSHVDLVSLASMVFIVVVVDLHLADVINSVDATVVVVGLLDVVDIAVGATVKSAVEIVVGAVASSVAVVAYTDAVAVLVADTVVAVTDLAVAFAANLEGAEFKLGLNADGDQSVYSRNTCASDLEGGIYGLNKEDKKFFSSTVRFGSL